MEKKALGQQVEEKTEEKRLCTAGRGDLRESGKNAMDIRKAGIGNDKDWKKRLWTAGRGDNKTVEKGLWAGGRGDNREWKKGYG